MFKKFKCSKFFYGIVMIAVGIGVILSLLLPTLWTMFFLALLLVLAGFLLICH